MKLLQLGIFIFGVEDPKAILFIRLFSDAEYEQGIVRNSHENYWVVRWHVLLLHQILKIFLVLRQHFISIISTKITCAITMFMVRVMMILH